jgi:hypothetical protein
VSQRQGGSAANGAAIIQYTCGTSANNLWYVDEVLERGSRAQAAQAVAPEEGRKTEELTPNGPARPFPTPPGRAGCIAGQPPGNQVILAARRPEPAGHDRKALTIHERGELIDTGIVPVGGVHLDPRIVRLEPLEPVVVDHVRRGCGEMCVRVGPA